MKNNKLLSGLFYIVPALITALVLYIITLFTNDLYFENGYYLVFAGIAIYFTTIIINWLISPLQNHLRKIVKLSQADPRKDILSYLIIILGYIAMTGIQVIFGMLILVGYDLLLTNNFNITNLYLYIILAFIISPTYKNPIEKNIVK